MTARHAPTFLAIPTPESVDVARRGGVPPLAQCRRLLGQTCATLTDEEVEAVRDQLAILAEAVLDAMEAEEE